jgi:hypothetical protein
LNVEETANFLTAKFLSADEKITFVMMRFVPMRKEHLLQAPNLVMRGPQPGEQDAQIASRRKVS